MIMVHHHKPGPNTVAPIHHRVGIQHLALMDGLRQHKDEVVEFHQEFCATQI